MHVHGAVEIGTEGTIQLPLPGEGLLGTGLRTGETEQGYAQYQKWKSLHQNPPGERVIRYNLMKGRETAGVPIRGPRPSTLESSTFFPAEPYEFM